MDEWSAVKKSTVAYTYEVRDWVPKERLVMSTADGPFSMETTYEWHDSPSGGTTMASATAGPRPASPTSPRR